MFRGVCRVMDHILQSFRRGTLVEAPPVEEDTGDLDGTDTAEEEVHGSKPIIELANHIPHV